jgi:hypothetical protein
VIPDLKAVLANMERFAHEVMPKAKAIRAASEGKTTRHDSKTMAARPRGRTVRHASGRT